MLDHFSGSGGYDLWQPIRRVPKHRGNGPARVQRCPRRNISNWSIGLRIDIADLYRGLVFMEADGEE